MGVGLLVFNFIGAIFYVHAASHGWVLPQEQGLHSVTGEPYIWALYVFPIWAVFLLLNLTWGVFHPRSEAMASWGLVVVDNSDLAGCNGNRFRAPLTVSIDKLKLPLLKTQVLLRRFHDC
jgi:hypothetical protein